MAFGVFISVLEKVSERYAKRTFATGGDSHLSITRDNTADNAGLPTGAPSPFSLARVLDQDTSYDQSTARRYNSSLRSFPEDEYGNLVFTDALFRGHQRGHYPYPALTAHL
jgi:hypothetical protein